MTKYIRNFSSWSTGVRYNPQDMFDQGWEVHGPNNQTSTALRWEVVNQATPVSEFPKAFRLGNRTADGTNLNQEGTFVLKDTGQSSTDPQGSTSYSYNGSRSWDVVLLQLTPPGPDASTSRIWSDFEDAGAGPITQCVRLTGSVPSSGYVPYETGVSWYHYRSRYPANGDIDVTRRLAPGDFSALSNLTPFWPIPGSTRASTGPAGHEDFPFFFRCQMQIPERIYRYKRWAYGSEEPSSWTYESTAGDVTQFNISTSYWAGGAGFRASGPLGYSSDEYGLVFAWGASDDLNDPVTQDQLLQGSTGSAAVAAQFRAVLRWST